MKRTLLRMVVVTVSVLLAAGAVLAQQADREKLKRGIEHYDNQRYQNAIDVLQDIDVSKLAELDRTTPALYISKAREGLEKQNASQAEIEAGQQALMEKKYVTAMGHFEKARQINYLSEPMSARLNSLVTLARQDEQAARKDAAALLEQAKKSEQAGRNDEAVKAYTAVVNADVNLPEADRDYARNHLAALTGRPTPSPAEVKVARTEPAPEAELKPVVTPTDIRPIKPKVEEPKPEEVKPEEPKPTEAKPVEPEPAPVDVETIRRQAVAQRVAATLEQADVAMKNSEWARAAMLYRDVLSNDAENAAAKAGLQRASGMMGEGPKSLIAQESDRIGVEIERTKAKVVEAMGRARALQQAARVPGDFNDALDQVRYANRLINENRYLSPELAEDMREEAKALAASIDESRKAMIRGLDVERQAEIEQREDDRRRRDREARIRQIESLWNGARQNADIRQYKQAADILDQLLLIDPQNERARRFRDDYLYFAGVANAIDVRVTRKEETVKSLVAVEEAATPWYPIHRYPPAREWEELTRKRSAMVAAAQGESEAAGATRRKMHTKGIVNGELWSISLALTETALGNVLDFIAEAARARPREINIIVDRTGITNAGVSLDDPVTLNVKDVSIAQALTMVLGENLGYVIQDDGTVLISSRDRINQDLPVRTYFVQDLVTPIPDFGNTVPRFNLTGALQTAGQQTGGATTGLFEDTTRTEEEVSGTKRLQELIERTVRSTEPWESMGGRAALDFYERTGLMIVSQTADGHRKLTDLLTSLRRERAIMVAIESRFVTVADAFLNDVTLDFDVAFLNTSHHFRTDIASATLPDRDPAGTAFQTLPTWTGLPAAVPPAPTVPQNRPLVLGSTSSNMQGVGTLLPGINNLNSIAAGWPAFGANEGGMVLSGVFLDDVQVGFLLRAIQADRRSTTLFCPRLTLWNGQRSWITDGTQQAYIADLEPVVAEAAVGFDATIGVIVSGTVLDVKATVSADRRYVQLDLRPQVALLAALTPVFIQAAVPGMAATATIQLPTIRITDMRTSVSVPDGGTLLIGGQKIFEEHDVEAGVPVLSKVPILKRIFSNRAQTRGQENLLILVKPTIIIQSEKEAELGFDEFAS